MMMSVKNVILYSKSFFAFLKVFKLLSMCTKFMSISGSFLSRKSMAGVISPPPLSVITRSKYIGGSGVN